MRLRPAGFNMFLTTVFFTPGRHGKVQKLQTMLCLFYVYICTVVFFMLVSGAYIIIIHLCSGAKTENREPMIVAAKQI